MRTWHHLTTHWAGRHVKTARVTGRERRAALPRECGALQLARGRVGEARLGEREREVDGGGDVVVTRRRWEETKRRRDEETKDRSFYFDRSFYATLRLSSLASLTKRRGSILLRHTTTVIAVIASAAAARLGPWRGRARSPRTPARRARSARRERRRRAARDRARATEQQARETNERTRERARERVCETPRVAAAVGGGVPALADGGRWSG